MNQNIVVLYASMTGNSQECAQKLAKRLQRDGHAATAIDLATYVASNILNEQTAFICMSTWGEGEPPDDASDFVEFLRFLEAGTLTHLRYSVLALGDSGYFDFCQAGKDVDALLEYLGAHRIVPRVDCDVYYDEPCTQWAEQVAAALAFAAPQAQAAA